jgi:hypothetical protein
VFYQRQLGSRMQLTKVYLIHHGADEEDAAAGAAEQVFRVAGVGELFGVDAAALIGDYEDEVAAGVLVGERDVLVGVVLVAVQDGVDGGFADGHGDVETGVLIQPGLGGEFLRHRFDLADAIHGGVEEDDVPSFDRFAQQFVPANLAANRVRPRRVRFRNPDGSFLGATVCVKACRRQVRIQGFRCLNHTRGSVTMARSATAILAIAVSCVPGVAQPKAEKPQSAAKLELSMEIATTNDEGYPSAIRISVKNVGGVSVDMPVLKQGCSPDNGIEIQSTWAPDEPTGHGFGSGGACGMGDQPSLLIRARHTWVRLRPGESMTDTERLTWSNGGEKVPGTVEYWVEYTPPDATPAEVAELFEQGYVIPTEKLTTEHSSFHVH